MCQRFRCIVCRCVMLVVPAELLPRKLYGACAIALALALWGVDGEAAGEVRRRISSWPVSAESERRRWRSLSRWCRNAADGELFDGVGAVAGTGRDVAARVAQVLASRAPPGDRSSSVTARPWRGASR